MNVGMKCLWLKRWRVLVDYGRALLERCDRFFKKCTELTLVVLMASATIVVVVLGGLILAHRPFQPVPPETLQKEVQETPCLKLELANNFGAVRYADLDYAKDECKNAETIAKQRQILGVQ